MSTSNKSVDRREVLKAAATTSVITGLAGCSGEEDGADTSGDGSDGGLGERVPPVVIQYIPDYGFWGQSLPLIKNHLEAVDIPVELQPTEFAKMFENAINDNRNYHMNAVFGGVNPQTIDPGQGMVRSRIDWAGSNGDPNFNNYANCRYTKLAFDQLTIADPEKRRETIKEAYAIQMNDRTAVPLLERPSFSGARTDVVDVDGLGTWKFEQWNVPAFAQSTPKQGDRLVFGMSAGAAEFEIYMQDDSSATTGIGNRLYHSPLVIHNENGELVNWLVEDYRVKDNGQTYTFNIHPDAKFHNGDPITAEDVLFTQNLLNEFDFPQTNTYEFESTTAIDDRTVEFNFAEPQPTFLTSRAAVWGILHKPSWESMDEPSTFSPELPMVGSGPFQLTDFNPGQSVVLSPSPVDHPQLGSIDHGLTIVPYDSNSTKVRALQENEIQIAAQLSQSNLRKLRNDLGDSFTGYSGGGLAIYQLSVNHVRAPVRYNAYIDAVTMAIDHAELNDVTYNGESEPVLHIRARSPDHPYAPANEDIPKVKDTPEAQPEAAKQRLRDAGWGWDDSGNLRYPADLDAGPRWPEGETPQPDDFPCLNSDGSFNQSWDG